MNATELRVNAPKMTKNEMIKLRNELELNWCDSKRNLMIILSMACINKFNTTISNLK